MKTSEILTKAKELISDPENWIKETYYQNKDGKECFCSLGAIARAEGVSNFTSSSTKAASILKEVVIDDLCETQTFAIYNDDHNHEEVMDAFDKAIVLSSSQGD